MRAGIAALAAGQAASVIGTAFPNPDGTIGTGTIRPAVRARG